ncbi:MAG: hypothetical protein KBG15_02460 [Kofleriaceae bacterium]|nr:hypothetical protein [Kofleriaceae bacterium]
MKRAMPNYLPPIVATVLACIAACAGDPSLTVTVTADPTFDPAGRTIETRVDVYETAVVTCDQIEFGDVTREQLAAFRVTKETDAPLVLSEISRLGAKVLIARQTVDGELTMIGCTEVGEIKEHSKVTIQTNRLARVSFSNQSATATQTTALRVRLVAVDVDNKPIKGRAIRWQAFAPVGATFPEQGYTVIKDSEGGFTYVQPNGMDAATNDYGEVEHGFSPPDKVGPYGAVARVSWADVQPRLLTDFAEGVVKTITVPAGEAVVQCVASRAAMGGGDDITCLTKPTAGPTKLRRGKVSSGTLVADDISPQLPSFPVSEAPAFLVVSGVNNAVIVVGDKGHYAAVGAATAASCARLSCVVGAVLQVVAVPACGTSAPAMVVRDLSEIWRTEFGGVATKLNIPPLQALTDAACVVVDDGGAESIRQVVLTNYTLGTGNMRNQNGAYVFVQGDAAPTPVSPVLGHGFLEGPRPQLLFSTLDITGTLVQQATLTAVNGQRRVVVEGEVPALSLPTQLLSAKIDGDANYDILMVYGSLRSLVVQVALVRAGSVDDLAASIAIPTTGGEALLADVDGDGVKDIVTFTPKDTNQNAISVMFLGKRS